MYSRISEFLRFLGFWAGPSQEELIPPKKWYTKIPGGGTILPLAITNKKNLIPRESGFDFGKYSSGDLLSPAFDASVPAPEVIIETLNGYEPRTVEDVLTTSENYGELLEDAMPCGHQEWLDQIRRKGPSSRFPAHPPIGV
jgi:hypothetical protein